MKVWIDVVHPKGAWIVNSLIPHLKGTSAVITARRGLQTTEVLDMLGLPYEAIGQYGGSLKEKFVSYARRSLALIDFLEKDGVPDVLYAHGSVEATRLAFGLGIPIVHANDTLINTPVLKLTVPLLDRLVAPRCIRREWWTKFGIATDKISQYDGVEEAAYVKRHDRQEALKMLKAQMGHVPERFVVMRGIETKASYVQSDGDRLRLLAEKIARKAQVVYLPRYDEEKRWFKDVEGVHVLEKVVNGPLLMGFCDLVVSSGGTMAREAALLGTPVVSLYIHDPISKYLKKRGFPFYYVPDLGKAYQFAVKVLDQHQGYRSDTSGLLKKLESPLPYITRAIHQITHIRSNA